MNAPFDRRTSVTGLSAAMREVRIRLARVDMDKPLGLASHHADAASICIEAEDDVGLEHHMLRFIAEAQKAAEKCRELKALKSSPPVETTGERPSEKAEAA
jgi:hypothetical protein